LNAKIYKYVFGNNEDKLANEKKHSKLITKWKFGNDLNSEVFPQSSQQQQINNQNIQPQRQLTYTAPKPQPVAAPVRPAYTAPVQPSYTAPKPQPLAAPIQQKYGSYEKKNYVGSQQVSRPIPSIGGIPVRGVVPPIGSTLPAIIPMGPAGFGTSVTTWPIVQPRHIRAGSRASAVVRPMPPMTAGGILPIHGNFNAGTIRPFLPGFNLNPGIRVGIGYGGGIGMVRFG